MSIDRFIDHPSFDTPNNPLTGTDQGEWPGGSNYGELSEAEYDRAMEGLVSRRTACLNTRRIASLEDL